MLYQLYQPTDEGIDEQCYVYALKTSFLGIIIDNKGYEGCLRHLSHTLSQQQYPILS